MNWGLKGKYNGWFSGLTVDYPPKNGTDEYFVDFDIIQKTLYPNFSYRRHCIYDIHP